MSVTDGDSRLVELLNNNPRLMGALFNNPRTVLGVLLVALLLTGADPVAAGDGCTHCGP